MKITIGDSICLCRVLNYNILDQLDLIDSQIFVSDFTIYEIKPILDNTKRITLQQYLMEKKLLIQEFDEIQMEGISKIFSKHYQVIAFRDASSLFLAKQLNTYLVTDDPVLKNICSNNGITFKNFDWLYQLI